MISAMQIGSEVAIHLYGADGLPGEATGSGRVIHQRAVQVLPPFDAELSRVARRADEFVIVATDGTVPAFRIRPGLVDYAEAAEILAREIPGAELAPTTTGIVVLETEEDICDDPDGICGSPWWCKVICLNSCSSC